jgi:hypothetical protein
MWRRAPGPPKVTGPGDEAIGVAHNSLASQTLLEKIRKGLVDRLYQSRSLLQNLEEHT